MDKRLPNGRFAPGVPGFPPGVLLDPEDRELESAYHWFLNDKGYVARKEQVPEKYGRKTILLHREIMSRVIGRPLQSSRIVDFVDHRNHDPLDNRRVNLRVVDNIINGQNRKAATRHNESSGVRGVYGLGHKWRANITIDGHLFHLGYYRDIQDAISIAEEARERWHPGYVKEYGEYDDCRRRLQAERKWR
jgi:hypothetical protein